MKARAVTIACIGVLLAGTPGVSAEEPTRGEMDQLKTLVEQQAEAIRELNARIQQLEGRAAKPAAAPEAEPGAPVAAPAEERKAGMPPSPAEEAEARYFPLAKKSPVEDRGNLDDRQEAAVRPGDYVLDPTYRGYIPIPRSVFMVKFNPKPRLDMIFTTRNPGDARFRFATANLPLKSTEGSAGSQFNATANGSQIRVDMRAPSEPGNFRLYYQNDFFGSDTSQMRYRLQHFFGQYYGFVGGFTYGVFEDPDAWPDTVDYEGPNAVIFARRPLIHYVHELAPDWSITLGLEEPGIAVDTTGDEDASSQQIAPDGGFNVRWTPADLGHMQFSSIFRSLGVRGDTLGDDQAIGWGVNLAGSFNLGSRDTMQFMGVYGEGIGGLGNDSGFQNTDAAFDSSGDLEPLQYVSGLGALTHKWSMRWRSTGTIGYVHLDNASLQAGTAYHLTYYGSVNLVYQLFKRLSIGVETLYGFREVKSGDDTDDVVRVNVGMVYAPFD